MVEIFLNVSENGQKNNNLEAIEETYWGFIAISKDNQIIEWPVWENLNSKVFSFPNQKISQFVIDYDKKYALGIDESGRPLKNIHFARGVIDGEDFEDIQNGQIFSTYCNESILFTQDKKICHLQKRFYGGIESLTSRVHIHESVKLEEIDTVVCDYKNKGVWIKLKDGEVIFGYLEYGCTFD